MGEAGFERYPFFLKRKSNAYPKKTSVFRYAQAHKNNTFPS
jgi:hypothetical protein